MISKEQYDREREQLLLEIDDLKQIIREKDLLIDSLRLFTPNDTSYDKLLSYD